MSHKNILDKITSRVASNNLVLISGWEEAVLAAPRIQQVIYNRWEINPEYEKVLN
jgi:hypothetical protein